MYPLVQIGPLNLSTYGLLLLLALFVGHWLLLRAARARGDDRLAKQADTSFFAAVLGAFIGGRLWYGLLSWEIYSSNPGLFLALQISGLAWPGALLGGALATYLLGRRLRFRMVELADATALALPAMIAIGSIGLLLSGEAFGVPTDLPWSVTLLGTTRHPTQVYMALAALLSLGVLWWLARRPLPRGALAAAFLTLHGLSLLFIEALRADSLTLAGGIRAAQVFGLLLLLGALWWLRGILPGQAAHELPEPEVGKGASTNIRHPRRDEDTHQPEQV
jgi:phosphatidylglycerol:prolipoprotein diacylglycerol transferase